MELLTVQDTARLLKVSTVTVRRFIADGKLAAVRVGKGVRVHREAIDRLATPVEPRAARAERRASSQSQRFTKDDALWNIVGIAGDSGEPTDIAKHELEYLADAYADTHG
jgi:excisionase family DNA binding protein